MGLTAERTYTRIQMRNRTTIFEAALEVFSQRGLRGSSLDQIATQAKLSKPNILYYFESKEAIFVELIEQLMDLWLEPLAQLNPEGDPIEEILGYLRRKLEISRSRPRESRLFANEVLNGASNIETLIKGPLKEQVDQFCATMNRWAQEGQIPPLDPHHFIFSIWATTQHYADFQSQIDLIYPESDAARYDTAEAFLCGLYQNMLTPRSDQ